MAKHSDERWHKFAISCNKCGKELAPSAIYFAANNEFVVEAKCIKCGIDYAVKSDWATQMRYCHILDCGEIGLYQKGSELVQ